MFQRQAAAAAAAAAAAEFAIFINIAYRRVAELDTNRTLVCHVLRLTDIEQRPQSLLILSKR